MDRYFTIMLIPEREKGVKSFRIPRVIFHAAIFLGVSSLILLGILGYDYWKILRQVYENKHLTLENRQLKEQIQLFHMKINTLTEDLERIHTFEKKLRVITGVEDVQNTQKDAEKKKAPKSTSFEASREEIRDLFTHLKGQESMAQDPQYKNLKSLYEQKIATNFGLQAGHAYTREWSELTKQSFALAKQYAQFDYQFARIKSITKKLERDIHELDQFLLDKDSFLKSTPTLLPTQGWITSYYGPRRSHFSGRIKMHEGLDIGARPGTAIIAPADGIVTFSGRKPGFGFFLQINHGYGVETIYAHAKRLLSKRGQLIRRGQEIAQVGSTGHSTGPHLHYEIRINGTPVDPLFYILD